MAINFPNTPTNGQVFTDPNGSNWTYETATNSWTAEGAGSLGAGACVQVSETAPTAPSVGDMWLKGSTGKLSIYEDDGLGTTKWTVVNLDATTTTKGLVQLADAAAITAGTAGRVVDAAQLKANVPTIPDATTTVKGIVQLADAAAITAGTAGRVVDAAQLKDAFAYGTGTCRAWVNFNGTGTVAIRNAYNVSSINDNGVGNYTVNFTTAMPDGNYAAVGMQWQEARTTANQAPIYERSTVAEHTASSFRISTGHSNTANYIDVAGVYLVIFR
jgi:hypothetical protein